MAAPAVVQSRTTTLKTTSGSVNYPASMTTGNLAVFILGWADDASPVAHTGGNLTSLGQQDNASNNRASVAIWYREIDGTEGSSEAFTFGADRESVAHVVEVSGWDTAEPPLAAFATTGATRTASPNPPSRAWTWSGDTLSLAGFVFRDDATVNSNPTGYTTVDSGVNAGKSLTVVSEKDVTTSPEDPGTFSCSVDKETSTFTIVIAAPSGGGTTTNRATAMAGTSTVAAVTTRSRARAAAVAAASTVTVAAARTRSRSAAIAATSTVTAAGSTAATVDRATAVAATSTFTASPTRIRARAAAIAATSTVAATTARTRARSADVAATSTLTVVGSTAINRAAVIAASSTLAAVAARTRTRAVSIAATSSVTASHGGDINRTAAIAATSSLTVTAERIQPRSAAIAATSAIVVSADWIANRAAVVGGQSACSITADFQPSIWTTAPSDGEPFVQQVSGEYQDESGNALLDERGTVLIGNPLETWTAQTGTGETWTDA